MILQSVVCRWAFVFGLTACVWGSAVCILDAQEAWAEPTTPSGQVTDDLVSEQPAPTEQAVPLPPGQFPPGNTVIQLDPNIDYSLPDTPLPPRLPNAAVINPEDAYGAPDAPTLHVLPQTNGTVGLPQTNSTVVLPQTNGTQNLQILTLADFLVKSPQKPEPPRQEEQPPAKPQPPKKPTPPKKEEAPKKEAPPKKAEQPQTQPVRSGEPLRIPPEAAKGDLSFLQGCWRGVRPEYNSKRIINERFCFDAKGVGKRTIIDPAQAGMCYGATKAVVNADGVLHMASAQAACTSGDIWGSAEMICRGEGNQTPCFWQFPDVGGKATQSYKIRFVRE